MAYYIQSLSKPKMKDIYKKPMKIVGIGVIALIITFFFDLFFLELTAPLLVPLLEYFFSFLTNILFIMIVLLFYPTILMWHENKSKWIIPLWAAFWIAAILTFILKIIVQRSRPYENDSFFAILIYSFPSSHTACAFAVLLTSGSLRWVSIANTSWGASRTSMLGCMELPCGGRRRP